MEPRWSYALALRIREALLALAGAGFSALRMLGGGLVDGLRIPGVVRLFGEQEEIFVRFGAAVSHRLWERILFRGKNVLAQVPAGCLQSERHTRRNHAQVLGLQSRLPFPAASAAWVAMERWDMLPARAPAPCAIMGIRVSEVDEATPVVP
jgi:hypothetical protein